MSTVVLLSVSAGTIVAGVGALSYMKYMRKKSKKYVLRSDAITRYNE